MNKHDVTVHIWRNSDSYENVVHTGGVIANMASFNTGHASLKLQEIGASKGDYYYLSFWPKRENGNGAIVGHFMPLRLGTSSLFHTKSGDHKKLATSSAGQADTIEMKGKKPHTTYRFESGLNCLRILEEMQRIAEENTMWSLKRVNCATAVAYCLNAGGAADLSCYESFQKQGWTPNRLGQWCQKLVETLYGEVKHEGKRTFYDDF